jgi:hypothetical protein
MCDFLESSSEEGKFYPSFKVYLYMALMAMPFITAYTARDLMKESLTKENLNVCYDNVLPKCN